MGQDVRSPRGPRCIALVGPFQSGKTTLLEAILARTGAIPRAGSVDAAMPTTNTEIGSVASEGRGASTWPITAPLAYTTPELAPASAWPMERRRTWELMPDMERVLLYLDS